MWPVCRLVCRLFCVSPVLCVAFCVLVKFECLLVNQVTTHPLQDHRHRCTVPLQQLLACMGNLAPQALVCLAPQSLVRGLSPFPLTPLTNHHHRLVRQLWLATPAHGSPCVWHAPSGKLQRLAASVTQKEHTRGPCVAVQWPVGWGNVPSVCCKHHVWCVGG